MGFRTIDFMTKQEEVALKLAAGRKFDFEIKPAILSKLDKVKTKNKKQFFRLDFIRSLVEESCSVANLEEILQQVKKGLVPDIPYCAFTKELISIINTTKEGI